MKVHLNGELVERDQAVVSVFDRGYLFGDGVYEGLRAFGGRVVAMDRHVARLRKSMDEARIAWDAARMAPLIRELLDANEAEDVFIYWQVTRGAPAAGHPLRERLPTPPIEPGVLGFLMPMAPLHTCATPATCSAVVRPDTRWLRGRLKSTSLLGSVLAVIEADEAGADDAVLVRDGLVMEATAANIVVALPDGEVATPSLDSGPILAGITRTLLLEADAGIVERPITTEELGHASEVALVGTTRMVTSVVRLDGRPVGDGRVGPIARRLAQTLVEATERAMDKDA
jgi:D-alanine transaminase